MLRLRNFLVFFILCFLSLFLFGESKSEVLGRVLNLNSWDIGSGFTFDSKGGVLFDSALWTKNGSTYTSRKEPKGVTLKENGNRIEITRYDDSNYGNFFKDASITVILNNKVSSHTEVSFGGAYTVTPLLCLTMAKKVGAKNFDDLKEKGQHCGKLVDTIVSSIFNDTALELYTRDIQKSNLKRMKSSSETLSKIVTDRTERAGNWIFDSKPREGRFFNKSLGGNAGRAASAVSEAVDVCRALFPNSLLRPSNTTTVPNKKSAVN